MARENGAREQCFGRDGHSEDVLGTSSQKQGRCKILFFALNPRFGPGARRMLPQLSIEIQFILRRQAEYSAKTTVSSSEVFGCPESRLGRTARLEMA
jgi:hypothetical protein